MAEKTKEEKRIRKEEREIVREMEALGIYRKVFAPVVRRCAQMRVERDVILTRYAASGYETSSATAAGNEKLSPDMTRLGQLERNLLAVEESLGITPSTFERIDGGDVREDAQREMMDALRERLQD